MILDNAFLLLMFYYQINGYGLFSNALFCIRFIEFLDTFIKKFMEYIFGCWFTIEL